jgi:hypothetical protein
MDKTDKSFFKDEKGRYITQSLFLELGYKTDLAIFTLDGQDKTYKEKVYPSLKKRYIEMRDPVGYNFANEFLYDWKHWTRIKANKILSEHVSEWEEELALALRSDGIQTIIDAALDSGSYQAGKWLNDRGWSERKAGRPSKEEIEGAIEQDKKLAGEFDLDVSLLEKHREKKNGS